jgi:hypothetical protein
MILYNILNPYIKNINNKLNDFIKDKKYINGFFDIHGTFSTKFEGVAENMQFISDIDAELWLKYENNKNSSRFILELFEYLLNNNFYLESVIAGINSDFVFPFKVKKDGSIINYDSENIKKK